MFRILSPGAAVALPLAALLTCDLGRAQCETVITAFDGDVDNGFGHVADMEGGLTAIGAPHDDVMGRFSGSVYVIDVLTGQNLFKLTSASGTDNELFGYQVAIGQGLLAVGAPGIAGQWGPTRVFDLANGSELSQLFPSLGAFGFGSALAVDAGLVVVGDHERETAYVYDALTGAELHALVDPSGVNGTMYGRSVALAANRVVIGAGAHQNEYGEYGKVFVYDATTGALLYSLAREEGATFFGWTVATTGNRLVVGSNGTLNVYDVVSGTHLKEIECPTPSIVAADGDEAFVSDGWGTQNHVVDLAKGNVKYTIEGVHPTVSLTMGADRWLVSHSGGGFGEAAYLWDVEDSDGDGFPDCGDVGTSYCGPANANSTGQAAWIAAEGSTAVADQDLRLRALALPPHKLGYVLTSRTQDFVPFVGGSQGNLCLGGQIGRYSDKVKSSGANGRFTMKVDLSAMPPGMQVVQPGETWNFQAWYRDDNPGSTSNLTDAVSILFQ